jgi:hypothetical protein
MTSVKVKTSDLLSKLKENKAIHEKEFKELQEIYLNDVISGLEKLLADAKSKQNPNPVVSLNLVKPKSFVKDYEEIIGMLEMSIQDEFDITQEEFRNYVLNIWSWTNQFEMIKSSYARN